MSAPSLANSTQGPLGCGTYKARLVNDGDVIFEGRKTTSAVWGRRLDEASHATVTIPVSGDELRACCEGPNKIEPLRTEVLLERNGVDVWQGWLMRDALFRRESITINAHDILKWTERRVLDDTHVHVATDLTDIALAYFGDSNLADLPWPIMSLPTGVLGDRTVLATEHQLASAALEELLKTGLDATVVAGVLYLGGETATCGTLHLRDENIDGDPEVKIDGAQRATRVIVKGANGIVSVYPPTPPSVCYRPADFVSADEAIVDQASADYRARDLYRILSSSYPYYVSIPQGSALSPDTPVHINALVPGNVFQFYSQALCVPIGQAIRLTAVDVDAAGDTEQVKVSFEPLGDDEGDA